MLGTIATADLYLVPRRLRYCQTALVRVSAEEQEPFMSGLREIQLYYDLCMRWWPVEESE